MKKLLSILVVVSLMVAILVGCASKVAKKEESKPTPAKAAISTAKDLEGKKIGVQLGTTGDTYVTDKVIGAQVSRYDKAIDASIDLKNGKIDAVVLDDMVAKEIVSKNPDLKILSDELTKEEYAIAVKKGNTELVTKINETLAKAKSDGTIDKIYKAYMQKDETVLAELLAKVAPTGATKVVMGTNAEFPPFESKSDKGEVVGYDVEIAKLIAATLGKELKIEDMAFDSLLAALATGKIDMAIAAMSVTDERKQNVDFSDSYYSASQVIIVKK